MWSTAQDAGLPIESVRMADGPMGIASGRVDEREISLLTPCPTALAASWDRDLIAQVGTLVGGEARQRSVDVVLAPNVNLVRSPLAGRLFEMFSEDPYLTGALAGAWIGGLQRQGVGAVAKHFVCNDSETDRHSMNSIVDETSLREVYLQPFGRCVEAGAWAVMAAYNRINGTWCSAASDLIGGVVKGEWGFDGIVMSDWFGTHGVEDAAAGLDLEMPGPARHLGVGLAAQIDAGHLEEERLDDAVERLTRFAARAKAGRESTCAPSDPVAARALLEAATVAGTVLLKNDGVLPLAPDSGTIAVIGPNATQPCLQGGSFARIAIEPGRPTPLQAITARFGAVAHAEGVAVESRLPPLHQQTITAPGGERGVLVEILGAQGEALFAEVRDTSLLIWLAEMPVFGRLDKPGGIRVRTRLVAAADGVHRLYFGGTGLARLFVNGEEVARRDPKIAPADIMGALLRGDSDHIDRELRTGEALDLEYLMTFEPARAQGIWYGCRPPEPADRFAAAIETARNTSAAIVIVGESQDSALESVDRSTTGLASSHVALIEAVCAINPRTVVVVNAARPVAMPWADKAAAILHVWFPGQEFGPALASVLSGDAEPGGRLPLTFARNESDYAAFDLTPDAQGNLVYHEGLSIGYRHLVSSQTPAQFAFGHGLGYADIHLTHAERVVPSEDAAPRFLLRLENVCDRAGKAVVQLYFEPLRGDGAFAPIRLVGFASVKVEAGQIAEVILTPDEIACRLWNEETHSWRPFDLRGRYSVGISADERPYRFDAR